MNETNFYSCLTTLSDRESAVQWHSSWRQHNYSFFHSEHNVTLNSCLKIRQLAAVLLRQRLIKLWPQIPPPQRTRLGNYLTIEKLLVFSFVPCSLKQLFLQLLVLEQECVFIVSVLLALAMHLFQAYRSEFYSANSKRFSSIFHAPLVCHDLNRSVWLLAMSWLKVAGVNSLSSWTNIAKVEMSGREKYCYNKKWLMTSHQ